jgi:hypothetical protein
MQGLKCKRFSINNYPWHDRRKWGTKETSKFHIKPAKANLETFPSPSFLSLGILPQSFSLAVVVSVERKREGERGGGNRGSRVRVLRWIVQILWWQAHMAISTSRSSSSCSASRYLNKRFSFSFFFNLPPFMVIFTSILLFVFWDSLFSAAGHICRAWSGSSRRCLDELEMF